VWGHGSQAKARVKEHTGKVSTLVFKSDGDWHRRDPLIHPPAK
jgi:hypothetical protein